MLNNQRGMTLLEIMIVLVILGGMAGVLITQVNSSFERAKVKQAKILFTEIGKNLEMYYGDCGSYPTTDEGLAALTAPPGESCQEWGPDPYLKKIPKDPWNTEITYEEENGSYYLISAGRDKKFNTADDITNGDKESAATEE